MRQCRSQGPRKELLGSRAPERDVPGSKLRVLLPRQCFFICHHPFPLAAAMPGRMLPVLTTMRTEAWKSSFCEVSSEGRRAWALWCNFCAATLIFVQRSPGSGSEPARRSRYFRSLHKIKFFGASYAQSDVSGLGRRAACAAVESPTCAKPTVSFACALRRHGHCNSGG